MILFAFSIRFPKSASFRAPILLARKEKLPLKTAVIYVSRGNGKASFRGNLWDYHTADLRKQGQRPRDECSGALWANAPCWTLTN